MADDEERDRDLSEIHSCAHDAIQEAQAGRVKWNACNSAHEGFAVALEEVDELWEHVKTKQPNRDLSAMRKEAIQAAAMFLRFAAECCDERRGRR